MKRSREIAQREKAQQKASARQQRQAERGKTTREGEDPDIAGIVPGPQPIPND